MSDNLSDMSFEKQELLSELMALNVQYSRDLLLLVGSLQVSGEAGVLYQLMETNRPMTSGQLAQHMDLTTGRIANVLKSLEKKGYVERTRESGDRRIVTVTITQAGILYLTELVQMLREANSRLVDTLGIEDSREAIRLLRKVLVPLAEKHHKEQEES